MELCESAQKGHRCVDDLCRGADVTLCGFNEELWEDLTAAEDAYFHQDDDGCNYCPDCERPNQFGELCDSCRREREDGQQY